MTEHDIPAESIGRVDLLLGRATALTAVRWDAVAPLIHEAMGIALVMAATYPSDVPVSVAGLDGLGELECVARALREVQSWELGLAADLLDLARLRVVLSDARRALLADPAGRG